MSENIPFDLQIEIIKKVSGVESLVRFRSVSKRWKSLIDSSQFIKDYGARHTQPRSFILSYKSDSFMDDAKYTCLVDDETFKVQQKEFAPFVLSHLLKQYHSEFVGTCHGLVCLFGFHKGELMLVIWNPSIGKSFGIASPRTFYQTDYGFGVCPVTKDPTIVKIHHRSGKPILVKVFTLSSGVWNVIPTSNMLCKSVTLYLETHVVIDRFIYWGASDKTCVDSRYTLVSFDLITKEFKVVDLPYSLRNELKGACVFVSKLRGSLVVYGSIYVDGAECCGVWVMEHDSSFRKLFTIGAPVYKVLGFMKSSEPIYETSKALRVSKVDVYDPCSRQIKNLGMYGVSGSFFMDSYKESLLLLNHSDSHIY